MEKQPNPRNIELGKKIAQLIHATVTQESELYNPSEVGEAIGEHLNALCLTVDPQGVEYENLSQGAHLVLVFASQSLVKKMDEEGITPLV
jgi:hypothetical protein